jgi:hypothetical protein
MTLVILVVVCTMPVLLLLVLCLQQASLPRSSRGDEETGYQVMQLAPFQGTARHPAAGRTRAHHVTITLAKVRLLDNAISCKLYEASRQSRWRHSAIMTSLGSNLSLFSRLTLHRLPLDSPPLAFTAAFMSEVIFLVFIVNSFVLHSLLIAMLYDVCT